ncbi:MAG TPA: hypothetical protein ENI23_13080 [bacterium]|nr:hypothetical protein [bacterium]
MSKRRIILATLIPLLILVGVVAFKLWAGEEILPGDTPVAVATASPSTVAVGKTVSFDGSGSYDKDIKVTWQETESGWKYNFLEVEIAGKVLKYEWSGDVSGSGKSITKTFNKEGTYTVTLKITADHDETATASASVKVVPPLLKVSASASPSSGVVPLNVTFAASASGGTGSYKYIWSGAVSGSSSSISKTFNDAGTYTATVTVASGKQSDFDSASATVYPPCPVCEKLKAERERLQTDLDITEWDLDGVKVDLRALYWEWYYIKKEIRERKIEKEIKRVARKGVLWGLSSAIPLGKIGSLVSLAAAPAGHRGRAERLGELLAERKKLLDKLNEINEKIKKLREQLEELKKEKERLENEIKKIDEEIKNCKYPPTHK